MGNPWWKQGGDYSSRVEPPRELEVSFQQEASMGHWISLDTPTGSIGACHRAVDDTWPAGHGFNCDQRADFNAAIAVQALQRTLNFFETHLR